MDEWQTWNESTDMPTRALYGFVKRTLKTQRGPFTLLDLALVLQAVGVPVEGEAIVRMQGRPNSVLIWDTSATLVAIVKGIASDPDLVLDVCKPSRYPSVFNRSDVPFGTRITGTDYRTPHWIPVSFAFRAMGGAG